MISIEQIKEYHKVNPLTVSKVDETTVNLSDTKGNLSLDIEVSDDNWVCVTIDDFDVIVNVWEDEGLNCNVYGINEANEVDTTDSLIISVK